MQNLDRSIVSQLKRARDVVRLTLEGVLPPDMAFISALVFFGQHKVIVTENAPVVIADKHKELVDIINAEGGRAILHSEARNPANMIVDCEQYRLITGDTIPLVTINGDLERPAVPMLKRDRGTKPLCVPGGFASSPDVAPEELSEELGLVIMRPHFNSVCVVQPVVRSFIDPQKEIRGFETIAQKDKIIENLKRVLARSYDVSHFDDIFFEPTPVTLFSTASTPVSFIFNDHARPVKVNAELVKHWELLPDKEGERNIVGMHGYTHIDVNLDRDKGEQLFMIDPEPFGELDSSGEPMGRNGVLLSLNHDNDWKIGQQLIGGLGAFENTGFLPWAGTLQSSEKRNALVQRLKAA